MIGASLLSMILLSCLIYKGAGSMCMDKGSYIVVTNTGREPAWLACKVCESPQNSRESDPLWLGLVSGVKVYG